MERFDWNQKDFEQAKEGARPPLVPQKIDSLPAQMPPVLLEGLLYQGEVLLVGGHSKSWKSWAMFDLLYCIANGLPWLQWPTIQGEVLHLDLELLPAAIRRRYELIGDSYGIGNLDNIDVLALRGKKFNLESLSSLGKDLARERYKFVFLDPVYRLLVGSGISENDAGTVTDLFNRFQLAGTELEASTGLIQHFSKGLQGEKEAIDRFCGSGVWGRAPDVCMTFTQLEQEECFNVKVALRHWAPIDEFAVRWQAPRFFPDNDLDPEALKVKRFGRPKLSTTEQLCSLIHCDEYISYSDLARRAANICQMKERTFQRRLREAKAAGLIYLNPTDATYALSAKYVSGNNGQEP